MCGIFAYISRQNISEELKIKLTKNAMLIRDRGPDNTVSRMVDNSKYLVFHRLCINDLSESGNQPINHPSDMNITIICNGEIYNWKALAETYGFNIKSSSDCEIIVHMYKRFGIDKTVKELDGVFSFVIVDNNTNKVYMGRDAIGVRPMYYGRDSSGSMCISSELKALVDICDRDVSQFPAGHYSEVYDFKPVRYYNHSYAQKKENNVAIITKRIREYLTKGVEKRLLSDRPVGCLLSGGLDSSLITALVAKSFTNIPLKTFSVGLKGSVDLEYARKVAEHLGTDHHELILTEKEMLDAIEETIYQVGSWDTTTIRASTPMYLLSKYIKANTDVTVVFSGEGSDEASGSYMYFHNAPTNNDFKNECERLIADLRYFDVLRSDRSTAGAGLEVRVPFLDKAFLNYYMSISTELKLPGGDNKIEKYLLRKAFDGMDLLPHDVLWRVKEGMSDGVSSQTRGWFQIIQEHTEKLVTDKELDECSMKYQLNPPKSKESLWFRNVFNKHYPNNDEIIPYYWLPKWSGNVTEASARVLNCYNHEGDITPKFVEPEPVVVQQSIVEEAVEEAVVEDTEEEAVEEDTEEEAVEEAVEEVVEAVVEDTEEEVVETTEETVVQEEPATESVEVVESVPVDDEHTPEYVKTVLMAQQHAMSLIDTDSESEGAVEEPIVVGDTEKQLIDLSDSD